MKVTFRRVSAKDLRRLNSFVNDGETARFLNLIPPVPMKSTRALYGEARKRKLLWYCIVVDGVVAGSVTLKMGRKDSKQAHVAEFGICIAREFQGRGLGRRAIKFILREARRRGFSRVDFEVVADNVRARKLYEKCKFKVEGRKKNSFKINGRFHDTIVMARLFR